MRKFYLLIAFAIYTTSATFSQVTLKGADVFLSSGALVHINDSLIVDDVNSTITNNGQLEANDFLLLNGDLNNTVTGTTIIRDTADIQTTVANDGTFQGGEIYLQSASTFQNNGTLQIDQLFQPIAGATFASGTGAIEFVGNDNNKLLDAGIYSPLNVRALKFNSGISANSIILGTDVRVTDTVEFNSGIVSYATSGDSLIVLSGGTVTMDSANGNSFIVDPLYRIPGSVGEFMRFPVGDGSPKFRPFWVMSAQYTGGTPPKIGVEYLGNKTISDTNAIGYNTTYNTNSWGFYDLDGNFDSSRVQVQFGSGDGVTPIESIIAQGFTVTLGDTVYFNLGQNSNTANTIGGIIESKIPATGDNSVIMIGQSTELRVRVLAYLEGAQNSLGGAVFDTAIYGSGELSARFEFGGITNKPMLPGKVVPNAPVGAVDSIRLILRDAGNNDIDTTSAWLMADGSIRDYLSGELNYAVFSKALPATSYYVVLDHRNHLRVRSSTTVIPTNTGPGVLVDFTNPANVFGGGGIKLISPSTAMIAGGNSNGDAVVNAIDYYEVSVSNDAGDTGYLTTDVLFNSISELSVESSDFTKVQENSSVLYFSTAQ